MRPAPRLEAITPDIRQHPWSGSAVLAFCGARRQWPYWMAPLTRTGHSYVVAVLAENPSRPIDEATAAPVMLSAVKWAFTLAARG